jgi:hypothetical protein
MIFFFVNDLNPNQHCVFNPFFFSCEDYGFFRHDFFFMPLKSLFKKKQIISFQKLKKKNPPNLKLRENLDFLTLFNYFNQSTLLISHVNE